MKMSSAKHPSSRPSSMSLACSPGFAWNEGGGEQEALNLTPDWQRQGGVRVCSACHLPEG